MRTGLCCVIKTYREKQAVPVPSFYLVNKRETPPKTVIGVQMKNTCGLMRAPCQETQIRWWANIPRSSAGEKSGLLPQGNEISHCPLKPSASCSKSCANTQVAPVSLLIQRGAWDGVLSRKYTLCCRVYVPTAALCSWTHYVLSLSLRFLNHKIRIINLPYRIK